MAHERARSGRARQRRGDDVVKREIGGAFQRRRSLTDHPSNASSLFRLVIDRTAALGRIELSESRKLLELKERFSADELMVITITGDHESRRTSYRLVAEAFSASQEP